MKIVNCEKQTLLFQSLPPGLRGPVSPFLMTKLAALTSFGSQLLSFTVHWSTIANYYGHLYIRPQHREHHSSLIVKIVRVSVLSDAIQETKRISHWIKVIPSTHRCGCSQRPALR